MVSVDGNNISSNALDKPSKVGNISQEQDSEQQKLEIRKAAAQNISIAYDNAINTLKQYQDNQGILNAGFYREKLGQFLKNNNITDIKLCCDTAIKTLEQEKEFATNRLEYVANHEGDFKREFKEFTGKEYDEDAMKEFLVNASNGEDWAASYEKAYNVEKFDKNGNVSYENKIVNNALKKVKYQEYIDGAADIVIMLLGTGLISKGLGKGVGAIGKKLSPHIPKVLKNISAKGLMKVGGNKVTVGAVLGAMAMQSATFSIWDASKNYINLKTKDIQLSGEDAANEWAAYKQGNVESAKFGAFAGLLSSTVVGKVVAGTTKLLEKPVSHAVTKNLAKTLDKSSSLTGKDIMQTFLTKQGPGVVANSAGMLAEISGFTMYETANEVTKELLKKDENGERHLPKDLTEEGLAKYLWKHFKGQATNLAEIKAISKLIFMHKGTVDIRNNIIKDNLSKCETLNNIKVEKKTDNGKTSFELTMPDGSKSNVLTMEEVIAKCNVIMQFDMASNIKPSTNNEESVTPDNEQTSQDFDPTKIVLSATVRHDGENATEIFKSEEELKKYLDNRKDLKDYKKSQIMELYKQYPKEVSALLKEKRISDGKEMPRFDDEEISQLAPVMNKYPEEVSALINENVNFDGIERLRFDGKEISQLAPVMNKYPEEVSALINENVNFDGIEMARYNGNGISLLAPVMNKYPEEVSALINENVNSYGVETPKFRAKDISQLAPIKDFDLESAREQISKQLEIVKANPEKYINGEYPNEQEMLDDIDWFFNKYDKELLKASAVFDKEALNHLLRMRFDDASEYLDTLNDLPDLNILKQLSNSTNIDDKPFMPTQKVEFIDLLNAYKENNLETTKIEQMAQKGKIDLAQLNIDLFNKIMKNSGLTDDEIASIPKEKLIAWDTKYAHLLSKEIAEEKDPAFSDLLRAANLEPDFNKYIHDTNNPYGQANAKTKAMYQENNMNYEAWLKPSKENEVHFVSKDKNTEQLNQIASQIAEDINTLMKTPVKGFLKKQYAAKFFKGDEFVIPQEYLTSKSKLTELVKQLSDTSDQGQLTQVWKRAKGNSTNPDPNRAQTARKTLTILDHLNQRLDDLSKVQDGKATKTLDLTIKMWDRNPQKDIFQGNYSTCCIGMGGGNGSAMPYYIMDTAYNMIELVDNTTGKIIGNALCYMVKGENGKPSFIIDNIEINNSEKPSDEIGKEIRTSMTEYVSKIAKDVTGSDEVPIYIGGQYNDVLISDLPKSTEKVQFIGDVNREDIYMDLYTDWIDKEEFTKPYQVEQWKLK